MKTASYIREVKDDSSGKKKMRSLYDNRDTNRLAQRHTNGCTEEECTVKNVRNHLRAALAALEGLRNNEPIPLKKVRRGVDLFEAISELDFLLPDVVAWCVYREPDADGKWDRVYCGSLTREHAQTMLIAVKKHELAQEKAHPWWGDGDRSSDKLVVKLMTCRIEDVLKPTVTGEQFTRGWT